MDCSIQFCMHVCVYTRSLGRTGDGTRALCASGEYVLLSHRPAPSEVYPRNARLKTTPTPLNHALTIRKKLYGSRKTKTNKKLTRFSAHSRWNSFNFIKGIYRLVQLLRSLISALGRMSRRILNFSLAQDPISKRQAKERKGGWGSWEEEAGGGQQIEEM